MTSNPLRELEACEQSVWIDSISRETIGSGTLRRLIDEDGISGVTANPTIFEKAIAGTHDYDQTIREVAGKGASPMQIYEALAIEDVGTAADILRPVYDQTQGSDGFVSIEVSPDLAYDTRSSIEEARRFWSELNRPNIMIKIPATEEGIPAIEELIAEGINVNITLIFAVEVYEQVMEAYLHGLERRVAEGQSIAQLASVASFFVSRVDTLVDQLLAERGERGLEGKAAIANAQLAYQRFGAVTSSERWQALAAKGAALQRPLWASTSTKNPAYPDTYYVDHLIGPHTVNTMPLETIRAVRDHGRVRCDAIEGEVGAAEEVMRRLRAAGIDMQAVTDQLTKEGVEKFSKSLHELLDTIKQREGSLVGA